MERKVIFHVDECGRFEMAAGNIHNMCSFYRGREIPVVIELLLNGEAVRAAAAAAPEAAGCRELLREEGVEIAVCNNALRKNGIAAEELTEGVRVVPAGVVELAERQFQGYAYIRPEYFQERQSESCCGGVRSDRTE